MVTLNSFHESVPNTQVRYQILLLLPSSAHFRSLSSSSSYLLILLSEIPDLVVEAQVTSKTFVDLNDVKISE